jgi:tRNA (adenine57-N1/adenine58-N1)-methyltransferase
LQCRPDFAEIESFETLMRNWHVKGMSVRPVHRMIAHSAFIIVARRLANTFAATPVVVTPETSRGELPEAPADAKALDDVDGIADDDGKDGDLSTE